MVEVAMITEGNDKGGIAAYSERFRDALVSRGVDVSFIRITNESKANPLGYVRLVDRIPDAADMVHVHFESGLFGSFGVSGVGGPAFFVALSRQTRPVVTTLHEVHRSHHHVGPVREAILRSRDFLNERAALWTSDATIVHTREAREIITARHGPHHRVEKMLLPVETDPKRIDARKAKDELNVDGDVLLTYGWVEPKKQYHRVVEALPALPDVTYLIAGDTRYEEGEELIRSTLSLAERLGVRDRVVYHRNVADSDEPLLFSAADAVVLPYERVSQSIAVNDALAYHCPVVASRLPAFEELREEYGCLLTYDSPETLRESVRRAMYDEQVRSELHDCAAAYTREVTWENFAEESERIYSQVLSVR